MNWIGVIAEIESADFDAKLNAVSGMDLFFRGVAMEPVVLEAYRCLQNSGQAREDALSRLYDLSALEIDLRYENPNDTSLAVLLWLTNFATPDHVELAATYVDKAPHCWYAKKLAQRILNPPPSATVNQINRLAESHEVEMTGTTESAILPTTLIMDAPPIRHGGNPQTRSSVGSTTWSGSPEVVEVTRGREL